MWSVDGVTQASPLSVLPVLPVLQAFDSECGYPSDMWSVGVMMYLMLSGNFPFKGRNDIQIAQAVCAGRVSHSYHQVSHEWPEK